MEGRTGGIFRLRLFLFPILPSSPILIMRVVWSDNLETILTKKIQFLFSWIPILNRVSCWREHWWHDFITRTWIPILHLSFHYWEMRSEKPLESLSPTIPSLSDPSWDHERVSTSNFQKITWHYFSICIYKLLNRRNVFLKEEYDIRRWYF